MVIYQSNAMKRLLTLCAVLSAAVVLNAQEYRLNESGYKPFIFSKSLTFRQTSRA